MANPARKAHFIGICGVGMSATAKLLQDLGWEVSGSDDGFYPPGSELVERYGIRFSQEYAAPHIPKDAELVVIGKNAKLTPEHNEEVKAAMESGISARSFPEVLEGLTADTHNIVVAGSYAKSTCTGLLAWCVLHAGGDPSYFLGAVPLDPKMEIAHHGTSGVFVLEGDEYPSSNWDHTSKFFHYHPQDVLLTSASHDHVNVFPTHKEYLAPFKTLLSLLPKDGLLVASADERSSLALACTHPGQAALYGLSSEQRYFDASKYPYWSAWHISYGNPTTFSLTRDDEVVATLETTLLGKHNVQNIVGTSAMLLEKKLVTPEELAEGVRTFKGIRRRLDLLSPRSMVPVYEGFGSSYEKARAAQEAMRLHFPDRRLVVVFEPHTFSWRNRDALAWYDSAFAGSDLVLIYEPATQGADTHKQLSQSEIVKRVQQSGVEARAIHSEQEGLELLKQQLDRNDIVLLLSSGSLGGLISSIPKLAEAKFPK